MGKGTRRGWHWALLSALLAAACNGVSPAPVPLVSAMSSATAHRSAGFTVSERMPAKAWAGIERLSASRSGFPQEAMRPNGRQVDPDIVAAFGTATPPSRDMLLHYFKGWDKNSGRPVLLVHGAIHEATSSWIKPHGHDGLAPYLAGKGYRVFAVTFAHRHGDNLLQGEQVANAIARIRQVTGAASVDVVAHSKGCTGVRALASGLTPLGNRGAEGIRRILFVGGAHKGTDYTFRHPSVNYGLYPEEDNFLRNAPMGWTKMLYLGQWVDTAAQTMLRDHGDFFPGQAQLFARWDKEYPLSATEPDWYTSYNGGQGFVSVSPGIDKAIAAGGNFMAKLARNPIDRHVEFAVLAGNSPTLPNVLNETTGPSDGVIFVASATATSDMTKGGAKLLDSDVIPSHHMGLIYDDAAKQWVASHLGM
jgi:hypothetical protein